MEGVELLKEEQWHPLSRLGFTDSCFAIDAEPVIYTWIILGLLLILILALRIALARNNKKAHFLTTTFVQSFIELSHQALGEFSFTHFSFVTSLFIFLMFANCLAIIPFMDEPTTNINTTLALSIIVFFYIQYYAIKHHGIKHYVAEYFQPFFLMLPLHVVGKLSTIISMSFRLFGNIFGGATIVAIYAGAQKTSIAWELLGMFTGTNIIVTLFFGLFEGFLQAFVFTMLTLTYLSIALQDQEDHAEPKKA
jgi:F-type H+-transporting ATPase subunit a